MKDLLAAAVLIVAAVILWGVGRRVLRFARALETGHATSLGVGLAVVVCIGGILNSLSVAYGPVLWAVVALGAAVAVLELRGLRFQNPRFSEGRAELVAASLVIVAVTGFAIHTQLPPRVFNAADDFQKYFVHPVRMLETGTLLGSPLGGLGSQTLGGQAFLQGFVLSVLPINYINGVDAVFGLMLLMLIAAAAGWRKFGTIPGAALGPLLVAAINPQYVNVSGLYTGAVLMATAVMLVREGPEKSWPSTVILGLVYAALLAIKTSFAPFVVVHAVLSTLAAGWQIGQAKNALAWLVRTTAMTMLAIVPWFAMHLPNYLAKGTLGGPDVPAGAEGKLDLLSTRPLYYGTTFAHYTLIAVLAAVAGVCAVCCIFKNRKDGDLRTPLGIAVAGGTCAILYLAYCLILGPRWSGYVSSLRYCIPTLLGCGVLALVQFPALSLKWPRWLLSGAPATACLAVVMIFIPSLADRYQQAMASGSILAFSKMAEFPGYVRYSEYCLSDETRQHVRAIQEKVPPGEPLLAWVGAAFLLDYRRNPIANHEAGGLVTPWARVPEDIHYILWQYRDAPGFEGFGVVGVSDYQEQMRGPGRQDRMIAARSLAFFNRLLQLSAGASQITNDGEMVLFRLDDATNQPPK